MKTKIRQLLTLITLAGATFFHNEAVAETFYYDRVNGRDVRIFTSGRSYPEVRRTYQPTHRSYQVSEFHYYDPNSRRYISIRPDPRRNDWHNHNRYGRDRHGHHSHYRNPRDNCWNDRHDHHHHGHGHGYHHSDNRIQSGSRVFHSLKR